PATVAYPRSTSRREALEGMLLDPQGPYTVTDNYQTNWYGSVGLARGTRPLVQPTAVADPHDEQAIGRVEADRARDQLARRRGGRAGGDRELREAQPGPRRRTVAPGGRAERGGWFPRCGRTCRPRRQSICPRWRGRT